MSTETIASRVQDQAHDSEGEWHLDLLKELIQGKTVRMYEDTGVRDFAYGRVGDARIVDKTIGVGAKNKTRTMEKAEDVKAKDKTGTPSLQDKSNVAEKTNAVNSKDGLVTLSNTVYVTFEKNKTSAVNVVDKKGIETKKGGAAFKGRRAAEYPKNKEALVNVNDKMAPVDVKDKKTAAVVEDKSAAAVGKDNNDASYAKGKDTAADTKENKVVADVGDRKVAIAVQDDSDDYLNKGSLFDIEDFICSYTQSRSVQH
jgi:hypothetical protein